MFFLLPQILDYTGGRTYDDLVQYVDDILAGKKPSQEEEDVEDMEGMEGDEDIPDEEDDGSTKDEL